MASNGVASGLEPSSLEYMEDPYFATPDDDSTPSFDVAVDELDDLAEIGNWSVEESSDVDWRTLPELAESALCIETEFYVDNRRRRLRIFKKKMREVRVTFQDLSKPYLAKVSSHTNYKKFLGITPGGQFNIFKQMSNYNLRHRCGDVTIKYYKEISINDFIHLITMIIYNKLLYRI